MATCNPTFEIYHNLSNHSHKTYFINKITQIILGNYAKWFFSYVREKRLSLPQDRFPEAELPSQRVLFSCLVVSDSVTHGL